MVSAGRPSASTSATAAGVVLELLVVLTQALAAVWFYRLFRRVDSVAGLFFGLWLIPMGWCVLRSGWMPRLLGQILIGGGVGYVLSTFVAYLVPQAGAVADVLVLPASVGEFWMVGYLIFRGVRATAPALTPQPSVA
jgi:uncharacterized protein DUF4386